MTDTMSSTDARERMADVLNRVAYAKDRVRITRRGKEVAAVVPIEDLELIERLEDEKVRIRLLTETSMLVEPDILLAVAPSTAEDVGLLMTQDFPVEEE